MQIVDTSDDRCPSGKLKPTEALRARAMRTISTRLAAAAGLVWAVGCSSTKNSPEHGDKEATGGGHSPNVLNSPDPSCRDSASPCFGLNATGGWSTLPIHVVMNARWTSDLQVQLRRAFQTWETAVGKQLFMFGGVDPALEQSFPGVYGQAQDGSNATFLADDGNERSSQILATTVWESPVASLDIIVGANVRFNDKNYLFGDASALDGTLNREVADLQTIATHEFGHFLGLAHTEEVDSIMQPSLDIGHDCYNRTLSAGDIRRIQKVYGCVGSACDVLVTKEKLDNVSQNSVADAGCGS